MKNPARYWLLLAVFLSGFLIPGQSEGACTCTVTGPGQFPIVSDPSGCVGGVGVEFLSLRPNSNCWMATRSVP